MDVVWVMINMTDSGTHKDGHNGCPLGVNRRPTTVQSPGNWPNWLAENGHLESGKCDRW